MKHKKMVQQDSQHRLSLSMNAPIFFYNKIIQEL
jgi:hypothetical protein